MSRLALIGKQAGVFSGIGIARISLPLGTPRMSVFRRHVPAQGLAQIYIMMRHKASLILSYDIDELDFQRFFKEDPPDR